MIGIFANKQADFLKQQTKIAKEKAEAVKFSMLTIEQDKQLAIELAQAAAEAEVVERLAGVRAYDLKLSAEIKEEKAEEAMQIAIKAVTETYKKELDEEVVVTAASSVSAQEVRLDCKL